MTDKEFAKEARAAGNAPQLRVAYTRTGKQLHAVKADPRRRSGRTLCGKYGYVHPNFEDAPVELALSLNFGCLRCQDRLDSR